MLTLFIRRSSSAVSLLVLVLMAIGFVSPSPKRDATRYYSEYSHRAYNSVVIDNWNKLVDLVNQKTTTDEATIEFMNKSMIPAAEKWMQKGKETLPPPVAEKFHAAFALQISQLASDSKTFTAALDKDDSEKANAAFLKMNNLVQEIQNGMKDFQGTLNKAYGIEFEKPTS